MSNFYYLEQDLLREINDLYTKLLNQRQALMQIGIITIGKDKLSIQLTILRDLLVQQSQEQQDYLFRDLLKPNQYEQIHHLPLNDVQLSFMEQNQLKYESLIINNNDEQINQPIWLANQGTKYCHLNHQSIAQVHDQMSNTEDGRNYLDWVQKNYPFQFGASRMSQSLTTLYLYHEQVMKKNKKKKRIRIRKRIRKNKIKYEQEFM